MKIMIGSDLHGSLHYARELVSTFVSSDCDKLLLLGDLYYHGPRNPLPCEYNPIEVAGLLSSISDQLIVVKGNCDSEVDEMVSQFAFNNGASIQLGSRTLHATHGHRYNKDKLLDMNTGDVLVYGHFHINEIVDVGGKIAVNVGSCSLPKDGYHSYGIVDDKSIQLCDLATHQCIAEYIF